MSLSHKGKFRWCVSWVYQDPNGGISLGVYGPQPENGHFYGNFVEKNDCNLHDIKHIVILSVVTNRFVLSRGG